MRLAPTLSPRANRAVEATGVLALADASAVDGEGDGDPVAVDTEAGLLFTTVTSTEAVMLSRPVSSHCEAGPSLRRTLKQRRHKVMKASVVVQRLQIMN